MDGRPEASVLVSNMPVANFPFTPMPVGRGIGALVQHARAQGTGGLASALYVYAAEADGHTCGTPLRANGAVSPMSFVKK